jgi:hypothetical protein
MKLKLLFIAIALFVGCAVSYGQTIIPNTTAVTQNFDGMAATTTLPSNWRMHASTSTPTWAGAAATVTQQASSGAPSAGGTYNFGSSTTERAVGAMTSGGFASPNNLLGFFQNTNAANITSLTISYDAERYRINSAAASVQFFYSLNGTSWIAVTAGDIATASFPTGASAYNFTTGTVVNRTGISITSLSIATNSTFYLRWNINTIGANSQGIAIDNVSLTATFLPPAITTTGSGAWNSTTVDAPWPGGIVPTSSQNVIIAHNVTTGAITRDSGTTTTINTGANLAVSGIYTNSGTTTVNGSFQLDAGGWAAGNNFTYGAAGILNFNGSGSYGVSNTDVFWPTTSGPFNVNVLQGGVTLNSANRTVAGTFATASGVTLNSSTLTLSGTNQINASGFFNQSPTYSGASSTLIYNNVGAFNITAEWTGGGTTSPTVGSGVPGNVTIQLASNVSLAGARGVPGNINIVTSGSSVLTLNNTSGDLYLGGNLTQNNGAAGLINNSRAVYFVGSSPTQTINATTSPVYFDYFIIDKPSGKVQLSGTDVTINTTSGNVFQILNAGSLDLNGRALTFNKVGGSLYTNGTGRTISSTLANATVNINAYKSVAYNNSGTNELIFGTNITVHVTNAAIDFGAGKSYINGTLQLNQNGGVTNAPIYGNASTLKYWYNLAPSVYGRYNEWNATGVGTIGTTKGYPNNVQISNNTVLDLGANSGAATARAINGSLTIDDGSEMRMSGTSAMSQPLTVGGDLIVGQVGAATLNLSGTFGGDLKVGGDIYFNTNYNFNPNNRAVYFIKNGVQKITAPVGRPSTFNYVFFDSAVGSTTVQLVGADMTIAPQSTGDLLTFKSANDIFEIPTGRTLILGNASYTNAIAGLGTFKGTTTSNLTLLGTGSIGTLNFTPTFQNLGTLTMNRQAATVGCTMGSAVTINTALNLTNGLIDLGTSIMTLEEVATITGNPSANSFVIADIAGSSGTFRKRYTATYPSFTFPIGDRIASADGSQYSPASVNFLGVTTYSGTAYINVAINDIVHPNIDSSTDYITRYWSVNRSGAFTNPNYTFTGIYLPIDVVGAQSNSVSASWNGTKWTNGSAISANTLTISGVTDLPVSTPDNHFSAGNRNREINIKGLTGGTNNIVSGSTTANGLNNTQFAATNLGSSVTKDYEIQNLGIAALNLTGTPLVSIGGANPGDFAVSTVPATPIIGGASTSFIITFSPTYAGIRTAIVSIANNDSNENPYTFLIQGTGICPTITNTITPTSGPVGTEITINSAADLTGATVTLSGIATTVIPLSANQIKVLVPTGATSGNLITTFVATGCQTNNYFTVVNNLNTSCQGGNGASDLFISEVTDSNWGGLTYVEIYNGTGVSKSLSGYSINTASNGNAYSGTPLNLSNVTLASGSTYVVAFGDDDLCTSLGGDGSLAVESTGNLGVNFKPNENDHIALFNGATKIDSWGTFGSDNWATSSLSIFATETNGATFRRKNTALTLPSTTYANADWEIIDYIGNTNADCANNDYSDIGTYNFISGTPPTVTTHPSYTPTCKTTSLTVVGTEGYNGTSPADSKELTYRWLFSAPNETGWNEITSDGGIYTGTATATLNISNISTVLNYQYYCQIRENTNTCYSASNAVKIIDGGTATWNGSWTNGPPTIDKLVIISEDYNSSSPGLDSFSACSVVVNTGKTLTITENEYVKIQNDLTNNGTVTIENNGSLVQVNDNGVNTGNIRYERNTTAGEFDYTYFSSPVIGQTLLAVSPLTESDKFFSFNAAANDWLQEDTSNVMAIGKGYIIRGIAPPPLPAIPPGFYTAPFFGKPNNGIINVPIIWNGDLIGTSNLIGNPYPSAIDADNFLNTNFGVIEGTLYFWTHNTSMQDRTLITGTNPDGTPKAGSGALAYTTDDYASYNLLGGVGTAMAPSGSTGGVNTTIPNGNIASGQAFFTTSLLANGTAIFNNSMRLSSDTVPAVLSNSQFFKTRNPKTKTTTFEKHRIWLNLTNTQGAFKQTLIGYITDATNEYDNRFDGETFDGNEFVDFYSINQEKNLVIQGRALPFDENDDVPLGFRTSIDGAFTINIDQADGVLTNQAVFIEDKLTNTVFDLRSGPFTFNTVAGTFNDRFVLRYTNKTLGISDLETLENKVLVSNKNKQIKINSNTETIDKVVVYDLLGRLLFKKDKVNNTEFSILNLISNSETLLVKVTLQNGETVTRKIIF